ncbi:hypothetical protein GCM10029964_005480 [Kibdelosporangium lantanae]
MTVEEILTEFENWAAADELRVDRTGVQTALELSRDHLGHDDPGQLEPGDIDELLMDGFPTEVVLDTVADAVGVVRALRNLLEFLGATGRIPTGRARALRDELEDVEPDFIQATVDGDFAGPDGDDPMLEVLAELGFPLDELAPLRLPDATDIEAVARRSPLLADVKDVLDGRADGSDVVRTMIDSAELEPGLWDLADDEFLARVWAPVFMLLAGEQGVDPYVTLFLLRGKSTPIDVLGEDWVDRMVAHNAVTVDEDGVRFTSPAIAVVRAQLVDRGVRIDLLPPPAEMSAEELVAAGAGLTPEGRADEMAAWLSTREPEAAGRELLAVAGEADVLARLWVADAVTSAAAWESVLDDEALRPYAKRALAADTLTLEDRAWLATDALVPVMLAEGPVELDDPALLEAMWRLPHPDAADVLEYVGQEHPDKQIAKAARRAAHKAATRRG